MPIQDTIAPYLYTKDESSGGKSPFKFGSLTLVPVAVPVRFVAESFPIVVAVSAVRSVPGAVAVRVPAGALTGVSPSVRFEYDPFRPLLLLLSLSGCWYPGLFPLMFSASARIQSNMALYAASVSLLPCQATSFGTSIKVAAD